MTAARARLLSLLSPVVDTAGAELEDLSVQAAGRRRVVRVVVDRDGGVSLDDVADLSRVLSEALDDIDAREPALLGGAYVLEVSSPGVDRPLVRPAQWRRAAGRLVRVVLVDGGEVTGRVLRLDSGSEAEDTVVLEVDGAARELSLAQVARGHVQVEFDRAAAGEPGADEPGADEPGADEPAALLDEEELA